LDGKKPNSGWVHYVEPCMCGAYSGVVAMQHTLPSRQPLACLGRARGGGGGGAGVVRGGCMTLNWDSSHFLHENVTVSLPRQHQFLLYKEPAVLRRVHLGTQLIGCVYQC
jgi:hypothetical protein